jgi:conjugative relaxase-like TrwC/TraI family protein
MVASVGRITAGAGYDYLTREVATSRHDYYTGRGEAAEVWAGSGLTELGLSGEVDADVMAVLFGRFVDPRTTGGVRLAPGRMLPEVVLGRSVSTGTRADGTVAEPVAAFDVTFSPAKSVSVLWATASDERVKQLVVDCHEDAVGEALAYLESNAGHTRAGVNRVRRVQTSGFIIAQFRHRTARSTRPAERVGDPQLHSHCAILNRVRGVDGRWRTLDGEAIYRHAHAAGALYAAVLERELSAQLGVRWSTPDGRVPMREIDGVPVAVVRYFSSRRAQVLEAFEALLVEWHRYNGRSPTRDERAGMLDEATVRSRRAKRKGDVDLHAHWRSQLSTEEQSSVDAVVANVAVGDGRRLPAGSVELREAVFTALHERRAWWTRTHVYAEVARLIANPTGEAIEIEVERIVGRCLELETRPRLPVRPGRQDQVHQRGDRVRRVTRAGSRGDTGSLDGAGERGRRTWRRPGRRGHGNHRRRI